MKKIKKTLSFLLTLIILTHMLPMQIFANADFTATPQELEYDSGDKFPAQYPTVAAVELNDFNDYFPDFSALPEPYMPPVEMYNEKYENLTSDVLYTSSEKTVVGSGDNAGPNISWVLYSDGELKLEGTGEMYDWYDWSYSIFYQPWRFLVEYINFVDISEGITTIGEWAFDGCTKITSVDMPSVISIGSNAFRDCTNLTSIDMPSVTTIGEWAFFRCTNLTSLDMPSVTTIELQAFWLCSNLESLNLPNFINTIQGSFGGATNLVNITAESNNKKNKSIDGVLFSNDGTTLIAYPAGRIGEYEIPSSVTTVGDNAFEQCYGLEGVDIPSVTIIGNGAFRGCTNLTSIDMPSVITIGDGAFNGCINLTSIDMPSVITIGNNAFYGCTSLENINMPSVITIENGAFGRCTSLTSIDMPSVITVGEWGGAFDYCTNLTSVNMPSVITIGNDAFRNCTNLTTVYSGLTFNSRCDIMVK